MVFAKKQVFFSYSFVIVLLIMEKNIYMLIFFLHFISVYLTSYYTVSSNLVSSTYTKLLITFVDLLEIGML